MTIPEYGQFAAALADHRFWIALGIAILAGAVRGFSGFGSAQIYIPLVAAVYEPRVAAVTLLLIDTAGASPFALRALTRCTWREVLPMYVTAAIAVPFGAAALLVVDPIVLRWIIGIMVLAFVGILVSGWRYRGRPHLAATIGVGLSSGLGAGAIQIAGPPVLIYWLGTTKDVVTVRANFLAYFLLLGLTSCVVYYSKALFTPDTLTLALLLAVPFFIATAAGARLFHGASELLYRRIAYAVIAGAALISLPMFDPIFR
jgi:uncharacterized protein